MGIHGYLQAWPEEHVDAVEIGFCDRDFATLQLEGEGLREAHAEEDTQAVEAAVD